MSDTNALTFRHFTPADILASEDGDRSKIKYRHHLAARVLGADGTFQEAEFASGYKIKHLQKLLATDEMFKEMVQYYQRQKTIFGIDDKLSLLAMTAVEEIQARLDDPETAKDVPIAGLMRIAEEMLDRSVAPSKRMAVSNGDAMIGGPPVNVTISFGDKSPEGVTIDAKPNE